MIFFLAQLPTKKVETENFRELFLGWCGKTPSQDTPQSCGFLTKELIRSPRVDHVTLTYLPLRMHNFLEPKKSFWKREIIFQPNISMTLGFVKFPGCICSCVALDLSSVAKEVEAVQMWFVAMVILQNAKKTPSWTKHRFFEACMAWHL